MQKIKDITFHYTKPEMVKDLLAITPLKSEDTVLDAGSGKNKVWYKQLLNKRFDSLINDYKCNNPAFIPDGIFECEIEDGNDFFKWENQVDWCVGNPPFHLGWNFFEKAMEISNKGIAFLGNVNFFNQFTPKRLEKIISKGFYLQKIHVVSDKRWFGRYYYLIFTKNKNDLLTATTRSY